MPSRGRRDQSPEPVGKAMEPTTTDQEETYVSSSLARFYLTHLTATLIHYQGFTSCQAEVIAELERKVEDHIANIFGTARQLAEHCGRRDPQSGDVISALEVVRSESLPKPYPYEADGTDRDLTKQLQVPGSRSRRERKAKQRELLLSEDLIRFIQRDNRHRSHLSDGTPQGIPSLPLVTSHISSTNTEPKILTISDSEETAPQNGAAGPSAGSRPFRVAKKKRKLGYMLDVGASLPDLPPRHTWKRSTSEPSRERTDVQGSATPLDQNSSRLSTSALEYLAESMNPSLTIPTELTVVNYRTNATSLPLPSPYPDAESIQNTRILGPLVQIDYTSSAMQSILDERLAISGYATDSRLSGSTRSRQRNHRVPENSESRGRKMRFIIPGLHKRQVVSKG